MLLSLSKAYKGKTSQVHTSKVWKNSSSEKPKSNSKNRSRARGGSSRSRSRGSQNNEKKKEAKEKDQLPILKKRLEKYSRKLQKERDPKNKDRYATMIHALLWCMGMGMITILT